MPIEQIIFIKPVEFLDIYKGEIFKVYLDYDKRPFIRLRSKLKIYLTKRRNEMSYYRRMLVRSVKDVNKQNI